MVVWEKQLSFLRKFLFNSEKKLPALQPSLRKNSEISQQVQSLGRQITINYFS